MANKQINELSELTTASGTDLLVAYDTNEGGSEKTKKVQVNNMIGGWILVEEYTLNDEQIDETISWDGSDVRTKWYGNSESDGYVEMRFNGDGGANYHDGRVNQDGNSAAGGYTTGRSGIRVINNATDAFITVEMTLENLGLRRFGYGHSAQRTPSNADQYLEQRGWRWSNTADDVTSIRFISASSGNVTGNLRIYKWNDVRIN